MNSYQRQRSWRGRWLWRHFGGGKRRRWGGRGAGGPGELALSLVLPALVLLFFALWGTQTQMRNFRWGRFAEGFRARQALNIQQVYAYGYQQRNADWQGDPWTKGGELLARDFGPETKSFAGALAANPKAFLSHVGWNLALLSDGLQLALLGGYAGAHSPDFDRDESSGPLYRVAFFLLLGLWIFGAWSAIREQAWRALDVRQRWTWVTLLVCIPSCFIAIATQRPRPSYIFMLSLLLLAWTLVVLARLARKSPRLWHLSRVAVIGASLAIFSTQCYACFFPPMSRPRPVLEDYRRLAPFSAVRKMSDGAFVSNVPYHTELIAYLYEGRGKRPPSKLWLANGAPIPPEAKILYLRGAAAPAAPEWEELAKSSAEEGPWVLLRRR